MTKKIRIVLKDDTTLVSTVAADFALMATEMDAPWWVFESADGEQFALLTASIRSIEVAAPPATKRRK